MTPFRARVRAAVAALPVGTVVTYGDVAREVGHPGAARAVGSALAAVGDDLPWWRVVPATGRLADHLVARQSSRLVAEGVEVVDGRVVAPPPDGPTSPPGRRG